jgi:catechol 2,3-dioxygenase-like lactoylglutathione lyase family enzyme
MNPKIDVINLGVADRERSRRFYVDALGGEVRTENGTAAIVLGEDISRLRLGDWESVAREAGVEPQTSGFRAFTLSFIVESADDVDQVLARAQANGGRVSKTPKNALWGYSAYVTDPDGYLWKVASSKRRALLGGKAAAANGRAVAAKEVPITIGVSDMKRAKDFYKEGLGLPVKKAFGNKFVMFSGGDGAPDLGMYKREALAADAAVDSSGSGFHGFSITHLVSSQEQVDELLLRAARAGGEIRRPAAIQPDGSYSGAFADLDGNVWQLDCER